MYSIFYKCVWIFLHYIANIVYIFQLAFAYMQITFFKYITINKLNDENILQNIKLLKKLPNNLLIIFGTEDPYLESVLKLIKWSILIGINRLDFYDYKGSLNNKILDIYQHMVKRKSEQGGLTLNAKNGSIGNGSICYSNKLNDITITFLTPKDSKVKISEICMNMSKNTKSSSTSPSINTEYIANKLNVAYTAPDLAVYFGNICSTFGVLPWHIRLTEFINIKTQNNLSLKNIYNVLRVYSNCQQRCGK